MSKELRKIMALSEASDDMDAPETEFLKRPMGPSGGIPPPSPPVVSGVNLAGGIAASFPKAQRPGAAKLRDKSSNMGLGKELTSPGTSALELKLSPFSVPVGPGVAKVLNATESSVSKLLSIDAPQEADVDKDSQLLVAQHNSVMEDLKKSHAEECAKIQEEYEQELKHLKESLSNDNETNLDTFRKKLAAEQLSEEKKLRTQQETFLIELRARIKEEGDEEEAKLMEVKQDTIRKLKQLVSLLIKFSYTCM